MMEVPSLSTDRTLAALLAERVVLSPAEALTILRPVAVEVRELHRSGILHRAISAEAVRLDETNRPRLTAPEALCPVGGSHGDAEAVPPELREADVPNLPVALDA